MIPDYKNSFYEFNVEGTIVDSQKLITPSLSLLGDTLSWNEIPGASSYELYLTNITSYNSRVDINLKDLISTQTNYSFRIKAISENSESKLSNTVEYIFTQQKKQTKSVIPTKESQEIKPDEGYILESVTVESIPEEYIVPEGTLDITENGEVDVKKYASVNVDIDTRLPEQEKTLDVTQNGTYSIIPDKGKVLSTAFVNVNVPDIPAVLQEKSITPRKEVQYLTPDSGYEGMSKVTIEPIPDNYIEPIGTKVLTENGKVDITEYKYVDVDVQPDLENIEITPTKEEQRLNSENAYGFNDVVVKPIPDEYIIPKDVLDITENGEVDVTKYAKANVNIDTAKPEQSKSATPTKNTQTILPDEGYVLNEVTVYPIPEEYIIPEGTLDITENGEYNVIEKASVNVNINASSGEDMLQARVDATNSCYYLFYNYEGTNVDFIKNLDTSKVTRMDNMFYNCQGVLSIPEINMINVTSANSMFQGCRALTSVSLKNTSNVENFGSMFYGCSAVTTIKGLDTSSMTNCSNMFYNCNDLKEIPTSLDTSECTTLLRLFYGCNSIPSIPNIDTSKTTNLQEAFASCYKLETIPEISTLKTTNMQRTFHNCGILNNLPQLNTDLVTTFSETWYRCRCLEKIDITSMDNIKSTSYTNQMCYDCNSLTKFIIRNMSVIPVLNSNSFTNCYHFTGTVHSRYNPDGLKDGRIYVPDDWVETLKTATNWSTYADIIVPLSTLEE